MTLLASLLLGYWKLPEIAWVACVAIGVSGVGLLKRPILRRLLVVFALLLLIGLRGAMSHATTDVMRDLWLFSKGPVEIAFGYVIARRLGVARTTIIFMVAAGISSIEYLLRIAARAPEYLANDVGTNRSIFGSGSFLWVLAFAMIWNSPQRRMLVARWAHPRWILWFVAILSATALAASRSRTLGILVVLLVAAKALTSGRRFVRTLAVATWVSAVAVLSYALYVPPERTEAIHASVALATEEVMVGNYSRPEDINSMWRGYESFLALKQFRELGPLESVFGGGFGQLVALEHSQMLGESEFDAIPVLHNGYLYILVKTGFAGVGIFVLWIVLLWRAMQGTGGDRAWPAWLTGCICVSTAVISGPFNYQEGIPLMIYCGVQIFASSTPLSWGTVIGHRSPPPSDEWSLPFVGGRRMDSRAHASNRPQCP